jgi:prepilin signal peptidase PulO-like enzyme (type II secretory pathway)
VWFSADNFVLTVAQAACVALPGAGLPRWAERLRARAWALALPLSIAVVVAAIAVLPSTANVLTWVALILVPPGCALALGWAARGARPWAATLAAPLLAIAWTLPDDHLGQAATTVLIAGSASTLGRLLAGAAPLPLLKAGVVAMASVDAFLVFSNNLQQPNAVLVAASPGPGLPQLQSASFGGAGLGYGDFFAAAVVGGILAAERRPQLVAAAATLAVSLVWDQLFLVYDVLPATIPPALVLVGMELWARERARDALSRRRRPRPSPSRSRP